jgi:hypothetical protein
MRRHARRALILLALCAVWSRAEDIKEESKPLNDDVRPTLDSKLLTLTSLSVASAVYDARTTIATLQHCYNRCFEANGILSPFAQNSTSAYAFTMGLTSLSTYATYRLKQRGTRWWWVPMAGTAIMHVAAGLHNQHVMSRSVP